MKSQISAFILGLVLAAACFGQAPVYDLSNYGVRIIPDKRVMVVLAALNAARTPDGTKRLVDPVLSAKGTDFRAQMEADLTTIPDELRSKISYFVQQHKKRHPQNTDEQLVNAFISMAFSLSPAPELADPVVTNDLPGELLDVLDFAPLAREFYRKSGISSRLDAYAKVYQTEADKELRSTAKEMTGELLNYMHTRPELVTAEKYKVTIQKGKNSKLEKTEIKMIDRRFFVTPEMLAPVTSVNFFNIRDDYYVVVPPDKDLTGSETRRAFLQFVIDPMVAGNAKDVALVRDQIKSLLDERRKTAPNISPDVFLAVVRSLVAAVDAREDQYVKLNIATSQARQRLAQAKTPADKDKITADLEKYKLSLADDVSLRLSEDYERGAVMAFYFSRSLQGVEESGVDIAASLPEMIAQFEGGLEASKYEAAKEARQRAMAARAAALRESYAVENPVTKKLIDIQKLIDLKDYKTANDALKVLLAENPSEPRIYYNMGVVASKLAEDAGDDQSLVSARLIDAKTAYANVLRTRNEKTDPALLSRTFVALGRIYEFFGEPDYALKIYEEAIKIGDVNGGSMGEALAAKQRLIKK